MIREKTTVRLDKNLKTRLQLLAVKNNISFNKMVIYILELGYQQYIDRFDTFFMKENKKLKKEKEEDEKN